MRTKEEIKAKIKELEEKKWKSPAERKKHRLDKNGRLNKKRMVYVGNGAYLMDIWSPSRFSPLVLILQWILNENNEEKETIES